MTNNKEIELVNVEIRPHLILFLFNQMEGIEASYDGQKVKMIQVLPSSSLGNYLYTQIEYDRKKTWRKLQRFVLYLSIEKKSDYILSGQIYTDNEGVKNTLQTTPDKVREINNFIEDLFRTSLVFFVEGCKVSKTKIKTALELFIDKYSLYEYGYDFETLRKMYYENTDKGILKRFHVRSSNQTIGYH